MSSWDDWSSCSVTCGVGQRVRKRVYLNPMVDESMCGLPVMEAENCIGLENECETVDEDCAMTAWSSWSPCSASCDKGTRQRQRYYLNKEDMARCDREAEETEMCVVVMDCDQARAAAESAAVCSLPRNVGPCRGNFRRWFYDSHTAQCVEFAYGGCRGNGNRFDTAADCERICGGGRQVAALGTTATTTTTTQRGFHANRCQHPMYPGPCRASFQQWYFDTAMGKCLPFVYGGCRGNDNRFETEEQCTEYCVLGRHHAENENTTPSPPVTAAPPHFLVTTTNERRENGRNRVTSRPSPSSRPVHCRVTPWSSWSACSITCGDGVAARAASRTRRRRVDRQPAHGGRACPIILEQRGRCERLPPCSPGVNSSASGCIMSPWSDWSPCSKTCGTDSVQERHSRLLPASSGENVECASTVRMLRRICSDLPPCRVARSSTATRVERRSRTGRSRRR